MASVKRHPRTRFWTMCYISPDGRRVQVSSGTEEKSLALERALKLERAGVESSRLGMTETRARRLVRDIVGESIIAREEHIVVREFVSRFFDVRAQSVSAATAKRYTAHSKRFLDSIGGLADGPLSRITGSIVAKWRDEMLANGLSPKSIRDGLITVGAPFREAVSQHLIERSPFEGIKMPKKQKGAEAKRAFSWEQFRALVGATDGEWRICILLGGFTGQRQQDVAQLRWSQVDFKGGVIVFKRRKTGDELTVPMHPDLSAALLTWRASCEAAGADGYVMPGIAALPQTTAAAFPAVFRFEILPRVGIEQPYERRAGAAGRKVSEYSFHSLRHMLSTALNSAGVSAETRMLVVGHADRRVSAGYTHAELRDARAAVERLPRVV